MARVAVAVTAMLACMSWLGTARPVHAQTVPGLSQASPPRVDARGAELPEYEKRTRFEVLIAAGGAGLAALVSGSALIVVAGQRSERADDQLRELSGGSNACAPGTPHVEECASVVADHADALLFKPVGAGLIAGGSALLISSVLVTVLVPQHQPVPPADRSRWEGSLQLSPTIVITPGHASVGVAGQF